MDFDSLLTLMDPTRLIGDNSDLFAMGSMLANNPEGVIQDLAAQGIPPPSGDMPPMRGGGWGGGEGGGEGDTFADRWPFYAQPRAGQDDASRGTFSKDASRVPPVPQGAPMFPLSAAAAETPSQAMSLAETPTTRTGAAYPNLPSIITGQGATRVGAGPQPEPTFRDQGFTMHPAEGTIASPATPQARTQNVQLDDAVRASGGGTPGGGETTGSKAESAKADSSKVQSELMKALLGVKMPATPEAQVLRAGSHAPPAPRPLGESQLIALFNQMTGRLGPQAQQLRLGQTFR